LFSEYDLGIGNQNFSVAWIVEVVEFEEARWLDQEQLYLRDVCQFWVGHDKSLISRRLNRSLMSLERGCEGGRCELA